MTYPNELVQLLGRLKAFNEARHWVPFHDPKNLVMLLASEVGELVAEYRWVPSSRAYEHGLDHDARIRLTREIGDVGIALLLLCDRVGVDLLDAIDTKITANAHNYPLSSSRGKPNRSE